MRAVRIAGMRALMVPITSSTAEETHTVSTETFNRKSPLPLVSSNNWPINGKCGYREFERIDIRIRF